MVSSPWTFSRQALVPRLFRDHSPSLGRGQAGAHRTQLPDELLTSKSWFILLICATTAHFHRVNVNFTEAVTILVPGIFAAAMADRSVLVAPGRQAGIDGLFVRVDAGTRGDHTFDDRADSCLLNVGHHVEDHLTATLDQAEDRWLLLLQRAPTGRAFQATAPPRPIFFATAAGLPLCPATT
jgi:hypothetical protein